MYPDSRRKESYPEREGRSQHTSGTFSGTSSSGTSGSKPHRMEPDRERLSFGDARVFFPESFVIPRQRPSEVIIKNTYSIRKYVFLIAKCTFEVIQDVSDRILFFIKRGFFIHDIKCFRKIVCCQFLIIIIVC